MGQEDQGLLDQNQPRVVFVKEEFFSQIESGLKTCELRIAYKSFLRMKPGQILEFKTSKENQSKKVKVTDVRQYPNQETIMEKENVSKIAPGISPEEAPVLFSQAFNKADVEKHGLVVIEFEKVDEYNEQKLEEEIADMIKAHEKYYSETMVRTDWDPDRKEHVLARTKDELEIFKSNPTATFLAFTNNFYDKFPGGNQWHGIDFLKKQQEKRPKDEKLGMLVKNEIKRNNDMAETLEELSVDPKLVEQIANISKKYNISQEACELMKRVYIAMRNKGYTHTDLLT
jgi:ASC-1-like (ASCH) protein